MPAFVLKCWRGEVKGEVMNLQQSFLLQLITFKRVFFSGQKCREVGSVSGMCPPNGAAGVFVAGEAFRGKDSLWLCQLCEYACKEKLLACSLLF